MIGFVIFFFFFGGMLIFLGIALIRSIIIEKKIHPYPYCIYPRVYTRHPSDGSYYGGNEYLNPLSPGFEVDEDLYKYNCYILD